MDEIDMISERLEKLAAENAMRKILDRLKDLKADGKDLSDAIKTVEEMIVEASAR